jgi:hypothetical protein
MSIDHLAFPALEATEQRTSSRSTKMTHQVQLRLATEMHRERLRSAERWRMERTALRARRVLAHQLMR